MGGAAEKQKEEKGLEYSDFYRQATPTGFGTVTLTNAQ
jgi:hypothetical protein